MLGVRTGTEGVARIVGGALGAGGRRSTVDDDVATTAPVGPVDDASADAIIVEDAGTNDDDAGTIAECWNHCR